MKNLLVLSALLLAVPALAQERPDRATDRPLTPEGALETLSDEERARLEAFLADRPRTVVAARPAGAPRRVPEPPSSDRGAIVFTVDSAYDDDPDTDGDGVCAGPTYGECQLRSAIREANAQPDNQPVRIEFDITTGPASSEIEPGTWRITLTFDGGDGDTEVDPLPTISQPDLTLDGLTQPSASCGDLVGGVKHDLRVILDGSNVSHLGGNGLYGSGDNFTVRGLVVQNFPRNGIIDSGLNLGALVECNYVGTDHTGEVAAGNYWGIFANGTVRNNLASGNGVTGIQIGQLPSGARTPIIERNLIGTDADGDQPLGNAWTGLLISGIYTNNSGAIVRGNVIAANGADGIVLDGSLFSTTGVAIYDNRIGLSRTGHDLGLGNAHHGIEVQYGASYNDIGLPGEAPNLIAGNGDDGIRISGSGTDGNRVRNNHVGLDITVAAAPNGGDGINISGGNGTVVSGNTISGNTGSGIEIAGATGAEVTNNMIGLSPSGQSLGLGNVSFGIFVHDGASDNDIGVLSQAPNYIADNGGSNSSGIRINGHNTDGNRVRNNVVGLDASGDAAPNGLCGILTADFGGNPSGTVIGGPTPAERNVVGSHPIRGICLGNDVDTLVEGNTVGLNADGAPRPNGLGGISLYLSTGAVVRGNVASGNAGTGILVSTVASGAIVEDNIVGLGTDGITPSGNGTHGIEVFASAGVTVRGNTTSANGSAGIILTGGSSEITLTSNHIGTRSDGTGDRGNGGDGVLVEHASDVQIGGTSASEGNVIAFNGGAFSDGVFVRADQSQRIAVLRNEIHGNEGLGIDYCPAFPTCDDVTPNDAPDADGITNHPVIESATNDGDDASVTVTLHARPNQQYRIELFHSSTPDPSGYGEGRTFVSNRGVTTDASGHATTTFSRPAADLPAGTWAAATATVKNGTAFEATSEFSQAAQVVDVSEPLAVTITPTSPTPPVVLQHGDFVFFDVTFEVGPTGPSSFEFWTEAVLPGGSVRGPLIGPNTVNVSPPATVTLSFSQRVPNVAPFGSYTYRVEAGTFPSSVLDSDAFAGEVVPGREAANAPADWEAFDTEGKPVEAGAVYDFRDNEAGEAAAAASSAALPVEAALVGAYPNPSRGHATVSFAVPETQRVRLAVYDVLGREVARLVDGAVEAGRHEAMLDGAGLPSGVYLVRFIAGDWTETQRITLVR